jgi:hypothetical protein
VREGCIVARVSGTSGAGTPSFLTTVALAKWGTLGHETRACVPEIPRSMDLCAVWRTIGFSFFILHPSSFILHPSSFILHPSSFIPHPSSFIPHPSSFIPPPSSLLLHQKN